MYVYFPYSLLKYFYSASLFSYSPTPSTSQALCVGSVPNLSQAKIFSVEALLKSGYGKRLLMYIFKSSACSYPSDRKPYNQLGKVVAEPFFKIIIKVSYSSSGFRWTFENVIQTLLRTWVLYCFFSICWAIQTWFCLQGNQQYISLLQEQLWD